MQIEQSIFSRIGCMPMSACIVWDGPTCASGRYGRLSSKSDHLLAHRAAYMLAYGNIPQGMCVCHKCDNGLCINPEHLFLGTHSDNMKDAARKKRLPHLNNQSKEFNSNAKYTQQFADEVRQYYELYKPSFNVLAKTFGLKSKGHAHAIIKRTIWS